LSGSGSTTNGGSMTVYGSYQPATALFLDGVIGYGLLNLDSTRYVALANAIAQANRKGSQVFGSISAGYEFRNSVNLFSPYVRYDYARDRLKAVTETGAGIYALNYGVQTLNTQQLSLGLRAERQVDMTFGRMVPRARFEYQHHISGSSQSSVAYADLVSTRYALTIPSDKTNFIVLGAGSNFILNEGLAIDVDYQWGSATNNDVNQTFFVRISKMF